mmetsp:Transcript_4000/g.10925  ORF Transcript_4000/g.10925 Transcript_4000/m.10925 type:complete len:93 (-) Transcript_4000:492-770(-)
MANKDEEEETTPGEQEGLGESRVEDVGEQIADDDDSEDAFATLISEVKSGETNTTDATDQDTLATDQGHFGDRPEEQLRGNTCSTTQKGANA